MYERPSTSTISAPDPDAMNRGSRPIERMARTGEFTPPGSTARAWSNRVALRSACRALRSASRGALRSACRSVLGFPALEVVREVQEPDLLELGRRIERGAVLHAGFHGNGVEDRVALVLRAPVGHREHRVGPVLVGGPLVAVRDAAERRHPLAVRELLAVGHPPDTHPVGAEARAAVEEDRRHAP